MGQYLPVNARKKCGKPVLFLSIFLPLVTIARLFGIVRVLGFRFLPFYTLFSYCFFTTFPFAVIFFMAFPPTIYLVHMQ